MTKKFGIQVGTKYMLTRTDGEAIPEADAKILEAAFVADRMLEEISKLAWRSEADQHRPFTDQDRGDVLIMCRDYFTNREKGGTTEYLIDFIRAERAKRSGVDHAAKV